jgi:hypothetical protein
MVLHKNRHTEQRKRIQYPQITHTSDSQVIFRKVAKNMHFEKDRLFNKLYVAEGAEE